MLIKIAALTVRYGWSESDRENVQSADYSHEVWINPDRVTSVEFDLEFYRGFAEVHTGKNSFTCSQEDARRIIDHINGTGDAFAPSPTEERQKVQAAEDIHDQNKSFVASRSVATAAADLETLPYERLPYVHQYVAPVVTDKTLEGFRRMVRDEHFVVLDTETTGLDQGEIVQIAIVEKGGSIILNTLVKPMLPIPADATRIHGITDDMVKDAPTWEQVRRDVFYALAGRHCVVYNAVYDRKMMHQSAERRGMVKLDWKEYAAFWCAMEAFAEVYGDWNEYRQSYRWQKLSTAAARYRIDQGAAHTALDDALTTLAVCKAMAAE